MNEANLYMDLEESVNLWGTKRTIETVIGFNGSVYRFSSGRFFKFILILTKLV